ncbi:acyltransferase domain-containing protein [Streptomyces sp. NPDC002619]|uniref:acyltransferase domain-containing protein n=1 Tax=Streptomyces sp. NPDC002619 TaxID=3364655 RepID=UPI0036A1D3CB
MTAAPSPGGRDGTRHLEAALPQPEPEPPGGNPPEGRVRRPGKGGSRPLRRHGLAAARSAASGTPVVIDGEGDTAVLFAAGRSVRPAMTRALYATFPVFRGEFDAMRRAVDERLPLPLAAVVFAPEGGVDAPLLHRAEFGRAALFAHHVALYRLWRDWGVRVGAVAGDGAGGHTAAYVAGVLGLDEAVRRVVAGRRLREHGKTRAEQALRAAGFRRILLCGPRPKDTAAVNHVPALPAALSDLHLSGEPLDWDQLRRSGSGMLPDNG